MRGATSSSPQVTVSPPPDCAAAPRRRESSARRACHRRPPDVTLRFDVRSLPPPCVSVRRTVRCPMPARNLRIRTCSVFSDRPNPTQATILMPVIKPADHGCLPIMTPGCTMKSALLSRLLGAVLTLLITWTVVFGAMRLVPGDPVLLMLQGTPISDAAMDAARAQARPRPAIGRAIRQLPGRRRARRSRRQLPQPPTGDRS